MEDAELLGDGEEFDRHVAQNEWQHLNETFTTVSADDTPRIPYDGRALIGKTCARHGIWPRNSAGVWHARLLRFFCASIFRYCSPA